MNYKNIKKGDHVLIPGVVQREPDGDFLYVEYKCGSHRNGLEYFRMADVSKYLIFPPENGTKNTEPSPKYDPCRKFRKGDRVELKEEIDGRNLSAFVSGLTLGKVYTVEEDEKDCTVVLSCDCGLGKYSFVHLRLVTPVEELEPYRVGTGIDSQLLYCNNELFAKFVKTEDAKRFCYMLNAAHRKEQS